MSQKLKWWEWILAAVLVAILLFTFFGCAVPVRNENNEKPLLTAPTGTAIVKADGTTVYNPTLPQPDQTQYQHAPSVDWMQLVTIGATLLGGGGFAHILATRGRLARAETDADQGWDHALNLAKQVPPKDGDRP